jgi:hypothetical protein
LFFYGYMKYQHIVIYTIKGLTPQSGENDTEIAFDSKSGFRAILTTNPEIYTFHGDQANAIGGVHPTFVRLILRIAH